MSDAAAPTRYHVIVNPSRILATKEVELPRSYPSREAAESECNRLNGVGNSKYIVIATERYHLNRVGSFERKPEAARHHPTVTPPPPSSAVSPMQRRNILREGRALPFFALFDMGRDGGASIQDSQSGAGRQH